MQQLHPLILPPKVYAPKDQQKSAKPLRCGACRAVNVVHPAAPRAVLKRNRCVANNRSKGRGWRGEEKRAAPSPCPALTARGLAGQSDVEGNLSARVSLRLLWWRPVSWSVAGVLMICRPYTTHRGVVARWL